MSNNYVEIFDEVIFQYPAPDNWSICYHRCRYHLEDGAQDGFRFIWRRPDGSLQGARGQARLPDLEMIRHLTDRAIASGWGLARPDRITGLFADKPLKVAA